jgi:hypothetical protein
MLNVQCRKLKIPYNLSLFYLKAYPALPFQFRCLLITLYSSLITNLHHSVLKLFTGLATAALIA